jgi:CRP-like cAMP-binding protein
MMKAMPWSLTSELAISMQWIDGLHSLHDGSHGHVFRPGILHRVPFFHGLSEMSTITICSRMKHLLVEGPNNKKPEEHRRKRDYIFEAGDEGHEMYIVLQGLVLVEEPLVEEASLLVEGVNAKPAALPTAAILVEERLVEEANVLAENTPPAVNRKREVSLSPAPLAPIGALRDGDFFGENGILVRRIPPPPASLGPHIIVTPPA